MCVCVCGNGRYCIWEWKQWVLSLPYFVLFCSVLQIFIWSLFEGLFHRMMVGWICVLCLCDFTRPVFGMIQFNMCIASTSTKYRLLFPCPYRRFCSIQLSKKIKFEKNRHLFISLVPLIFTTWLSIIYETLSTGL